MRNIHRNGLTTTGTQGTCLVVTSLVVGIAVRTECLRKVYVRFAVALLARMSRCNLWQHGKLRQWPADTRGTKTRLLSACRFLIRKRHLRLGTGTVCRLVVVG